MNPIEGDLIQDSNGIIFDVKGLVHPFDRIIAFPRFIPDSSGNRKHEDQTYKKVYNLSARFKFLEGNFPSYLIYDPVFDETLCEVPATAVKRRYKPVQKLWDLRTCRNLGELGRTALMLMESLKKTADVPWRALGISGSLLVGLQTPKSDIDPVVYGSENCCKVHAALKSIVKDDNSRFRPYTQGDLRKLFEFRSKDTHMSFENFVKTEARKVLQGKFMEKDYFIRFVKDWAEMDEKYGEIRYKNCGYAKIRATVEDDSESIFTPCRYKVKNVTIIEGPKPQPILEIASFRGRFCEQARKDEVVITQGKIEHVMDSKRGLEYFRILLGNKPSDYMALA